jgi:SAM-dependent methyltransferase
VSRRPLAPPTTDSRDSVGRAPIGDRYRQAVRRRYIRLRYRGQGVECPCCGRNWRAFVPDWNRSNAICPGCGSHERHRALWLFLQERTGVPSEPLVVLHFSPEYALERRLRELPQLSYVSADIDPRRADVQADITAMTFPDESFDVVICSHVLEHVDDDRAAMRELRRVLKPDGVAIVMVPVDRARAETYEDPSITAPADRLREFWQEDHLRLYGRDLADRLRGEGLACEQVSFVAELPATVVERHGLDRGDDMYLCRRPS